MGNPIAISLSPNAEKDDVILALKTLFRPIQWFNFRHTEKLENEFARMFSKEYSGIAVNSGRSALYLILKTLNLKATEKVALQALTCVAVPNSVSWAGGQPLYIDVDKTFNLDPIDLEKKLTKDVKAVIVQHAFGVPANIAAIKSIAKRHKLLLIEDCAISLGAKYRGGKVGSFGDAAFFSFGRDKIISSVFGGMVVSKNKKLIKAIKDIRDELKYPSFTWFLQQLLHPIIFSFILPLYNFGFGRFTLGKMLLFIVQKLHILTKPVYPIEKYGLKPEVFPMKMPGGLSLLALNQIKKLNKFNEKRSAISEKYFKLIRNKDIILPVKHDGAVWLRFPVLSAKRDYYLSQAKKRGMLLGDWYKKSVVPVNDLYRVRYSAGSCPNAEFYSKQIFNLPTYPKLSTKQINKVIQFINE